MTSPSLVCCIHCCTPTIPSNRRPRTSKKFHGSLPRLCKTRAKDRGTSVSAGLRLRRKKHARPRAWFANVCGRRGTRYNLLGPLANALAPIFIGLIAGYLASRRKIVDPANVGPLVTFTMSFALPCSLFRSIVDTPPSMLPQLKWIALVMAITYTLTFALLYTMSRFALRSSISNTAVLALTIAFPNIAAFGLPLLATIDGPRAAASGTIALAVGAVTVSPMTLAMLQTEHEHSE